MILNIRRAGDLTIMQASGNPQELATFIELAGLTEVPIIVCEGEDVVLDVELEMGTVQ